MIYKQIVCKKQFLNKPGLICLHTVKWFQVLLSNTNSFIYIVKWFVTLTIQFNISHLFEDGTLIGSTTLGQSRLGSNDNEEVLYILKHSRVGASPSDAVKCHTKDMLERGRIAEVRRYHYHSPIYLD